MIELTAIDVLVDPDEEAIERAREVNAKLLESLPQGWKLDETHQPHITTLQRYVRTADLDNVYDAVEKTVGNTDTAALSYRALGITHADWGFPGYGPTVLQVQVSPKVLDFQATLVAALEPFVESGGTAEAFVTDPGEVISPTIIDWVEKFVPNQIGDGKYFPHLTVGVDTFEHLKIIEAEPFDAFEVHPASVALYHLGNNGTARKLLKSWPVTNS
jgi:2'-5' RNA ligase